MTFWTTGPQADPIGGVAAGGEASFAEIWASSRESMILAGNVNSRAEALERAYQSRIDAIAGATGERLANPMLAVSDGLADGSIIGEEGVDAEAVRRQAALAFDRRIGEIAGQYPDLRDVIGADRDILDDAGALARSADEAAATDFSSTSGVGRWLATFGGGMAGSLRDPVQVATLFIGAGPSAARLAGARILSVAAREALLSGASEAALQPFVQDWRADAGLDAGFDEAVRDVAAATLFGGAFGAVFGTAGEALNHAGRQLADRAQDPTARSVLAGETVPADDLAAFVDPIRDDLSDEARGAMMAVETERAMPTLPDGLAGDPSNVVRAANRAASEPTYIAQLQEQIANDLRRAESGDAAVSLLRFLARRGGIRDEGEFAAQGFANPFVPGSGQLFRRSGVPLDQAREMAAEAGYFANAGEAATATTTVADFLDLVRDELNGRPVYSMLDQDMVDARRQIGELQDMQRQLDDVEGALAEEDLRGLSPDMVDDAARMLVENPDMHPDDAVEQAIMTAYYRDGDGVPLEDDNGQAISQPEPGDAGQQRAEDSGTGVLDESWPGPGTVEGTGGQPALSRPPETSPELLSRLDPPPPDGPEPTAFAAEVETLRQRQAGVEDDLLVPGETRIDEDGVSVQAVVRLSDALKDVEAVRDEAALVRACRL